MVIRVLAYFAALVVLVALLLAGSVAWLLHAESGTRWLLTKAPNWAGIELHAGRVEGALLGTLHLEKVEILFDETRLQIDSLQMQNAVRNLLPLRLSVTRLHVNGLRLETPAETASPTEEEAAPETFTWRWPEPPPALRFVELQVASLILDAARWQSGAETRIAFERLAAAISWRDGTLQIRDVVYAAPDLSLQGSLAVGTAPAAVNADLRLVPGGRQEGPIEQVQARLDLEPGPDAMPQGAAELSLHGPDGVVMAAATQLRLAEDRLHFRDLHIRRPGRQGELTGHGRIEFGGPQPRLFTALQVDRLDLEPETGQPLLLSGTTEISGWLEDYRGHFSLKNRATGLADLQLAGSLQGSLQGITLADLEGQWLGGTLQGELAADWEQGWQVTGQVAGNHLDPAQIDPRVAGDINLQLQADLGRKGTEPPAGNLQIQLYESRLHGQPLSGAADVAFQGQALDIKTMHLQGDGFQLQASGRPAERIQVAFDIQQLTNLLPDAEGQIAGTGWLQLQESGLAVALEAQGADFSFDQWQLASLEIEGDIAESGHIFHLKLTGRELSSSQPALTVRQLQLSLNGGLSDHDLTVEVVHDEATLAATASGAWQQASWQGRLSTLQVQGTDLAAWRLQQPADLLLSKQEIRFDEMHFSGGDRGELHLRGRLRPDEEVLAAEVRWQELDLSLFDPWLAEFSLAGRSSGTIDVAEDISRSMQASLSATAKIDTGTATFNIEQSQLRLDWSPQGLTGLASLQLDNGAALEANLTSNQQPDYGLPGQGSLQLTGSAFPVLMLTPWLPPELNAAGTLNWTAQGSWQAGTAMDLNGRVEVRNGRLAWQEEEGIVTADIQAADLSWQWRERLQGQLNVLLEEHGRIDSSFSLPLPARFPLQLEDQMPLTADLQASLREKGLLALLFPSRVQESRGLLEIDLQVAGTFRQPDLRGQFSLSEAQAYLPPAGIQLQDIALQGVFDGSRLEIQSLQIRSGEGRLHGQGRMQLSDWRPGAYRLELTGENFRLVNLPDLQVVISPQLQVEGQGKDLRMRGEIRLPEVVITGGPAGGPAQNSPDLVVVDRAEPAGPSLALNHDIRVELILGERVLLKMAGIDARLTGEMEVQSAADQDLAAYGEIQVAKGSYSTYGIRLDITRGNLFFTGGPIARPTLDILALRKAGDVKAGVQVTGTPQNPVVNLYSEPPMPDTEILSYLVLGQPLGSDASQSSLLLTAAGTLLSRGESVMLQDKLKRQLGLDVLDISAGEGDVESSVITTGKYLSPDLYVSLGYSLFTNTNELKIRYNLGPDWELESTIGIESGVDLFYRIELD